MTRDGLNFGLFYTWFDTLFNDKESPIPELVGRRRFLNMLLFRSADYPSEEGNGGEIAPPF